MAYIYLINSQPMSLSYQDFSFVLINHAALDLSHS